MIRKQLQDRGIMDSRVLEAFRDIPRERFVPKEMQAHTFEDRPLPIGAGQTISQPYMTAFMTQLLEVRDTSQVLEIGTGSGYQTAILASIARRVHTVEKIEELSLRAKTTLDNLGFNNVIYHVADGSRGCVYPGPFDQIVVTAAAPAIPTPLLEQLTDGGIMVVPVGERTHQILLKVTREGHDYRHERLCPCVFVPLLGAGGFLDEDEEDY
ncbi:MAG: protein-L-isoaspartate(D-aspartate) O-methyltransferase [Candidatus Omnitrophica bacterium]|nr:protein-L-isoaspartate(D-aspartate) O-methyltransferase [Candidatus Omnitrophota bacterium]